MNKKSETISTTMKRNRRAHLVGKVMSTKASKTVKVQIQGKKKHPFYEKIISTRTNAVAHSEVDGIKVGDFVKIMSCRPMSRTKRWVVLSKATLN